MAGAGVNHVRLMQPRQVETAPALAEQKKHLNLIIFKHEGFVARLVASQLERLLMKLMVNIGCFSQ